MVEEASCAWRALMPLKSPPSQQAAGGTLGRGSQGQLVLSRAHDRCSQPLGEPLEGAVCGSAVREQGEQGGYQAPQGLLPCLHNRRQSPACPW